MPRTRPRHRHPRRNPQPSLPFKFGEHFTIAPTAGYASVLDGTLRNDVTHPDNFWFGLTTTIEF